MNWRRWSDSITIQPFYFRLDQKHSDDQDKRNIHSPGLRFYGVVGDSNFDYDFIGVSQFGGSANETHRAYAYATEIGYTQNHQWQPRYSLVYGYASGDKNPHDKKISASKDSTASTDLGQTAITSNGKIYKHLKVVSNSNQLVRLELKAVIVFTGLPKLPTLGHEEICATNLVATAKQLVKILISERFFL